jgi:hypothetical protein
VQHWNPTDEWVVSDRPAHPALVSEADFVAVQAIRSTRAASDGNPRAYRLAGLLQCGICGRRLDSHGVNNRPGYRCRHGYNSAHPTTDREDRERIVYVREDELLDDLAAMLTRESGRAPTSEEVLALLRERQTTVICSHTHRALSPAHADHDGPPTVRHSVLAHAAGRAVVSNPVDSLDRRPAAWPMLLVTGVIVPDVINGQPSWHACRMTWDEQIDPVRTRSVRCPCRRTSPALSGEGCGGCVAGRSRRTRPAGPGSLGSSGTSSAGSP